VIGYLVRCCQGWAQSNAAELGIYILKTWHLKGTTTFASLHLQLSEIFGKKFKPDNTLVVKSLLVLTS